jgi:hypothetical protein
VAGEGAILGDAGTILDRQTLYELVWSKPTAYLAQEYGISDVAIGKMCQGMNIPKPPRGYWAKVRRGHKLPRPPLPPDSTSARTQVVIHPPKPRPPRPDPPPPAGPDIPVPTQLHDPHRLVARTAAVLKKQKPGRDGIVFPYGDGALKIEVSEASRERALLIMDTLVKALEQRGHAVAINSDYRRDTVVTVNGEPLALRLRERSLRSAHVMTADEEKRFLKDGYEPYTKYDYRPNGVGLEALVARIHRERIEREEAHRRWQEEQRRREEEKRRREEEAKQFEQLRQDGAHWREAREASTSRRRRPACSRSQSVPRLPSRTMPEHEPVLHVRSMPGRRRDGTSAAR